MELFIGTKIIKGEYMHKEDFDVLFKNGKPIAPKPDIDTTVRGDFSGGMHVVYSQPDGGEYHSWSPKGVFDDCHRTITHYERDMVFSSIKNEFKDIK